MWGRRPWVLVAACLLLLVGTGSVSDAPAPDSTSIETAAADRSAGPHLRPRPTPSTTTTTAPDGEEGAAGGRGQGGRTTSTPAQPPPPLQMAVPTSSLIAQVAGPEVGVHSVPDGPLIHVFGATTEFGSPQTFLVRGSAGDWLEVLLPVRPNGSTGWVHVDQIRLLHTDLALGIDLRSRRLSLFQGGAPVLTTWVATGTAGAPTPVGLHYVTDLVAPPNPHGAYGPYAFGLSAHSPTHTEFMGGDGQVGIHGTNASWSIGRAVSQGCVRLPNQTITQLAQMLPLGVPVQIV